MSEILVTGRDGSTRTLAALDGAPLMDTLRDEGTGIEGTCGGAMSCGTCHVYIDPAWLDRLPPKGEDEQAMLDAIGELVEVRANSRLSCQIPMKPEFAGIPITIAPPV